MQYTIDKYSRLVITIDDQDRKNFADYDDDNERLKAVEDCFHCVFMENDQWRFIGPEICGDLTDADMIGVLGESEEHPLSKWPTWDVGAGTGYVSEGSHARAKVLLRYAYMSYQVRDWREELIETGECIWTGGLTEQDNDPAVIRSLLCLPPAPVENPVG